MIMHKKSAVSFIIPSKDFHFEGTVESLREIICDLYWEVRDSAPSYGPDKKSIHVSIVMETLSESELKEYE